MSAEIGGNASVKCPICGGDSSVVETRRTSYGTRRRRKCESAKKCTGFTTVEIVVPWADFPVRDIRIVRLADIESLTQIAARIASDSGFEPEASTQCQMLAQRSGANCCVLKRNHKGDHVTQHGDRSGPWLTREEFERWGATRYRRPGRPPKAPSEE